MEKIVYLVWRDAATPIDVLSATLREQVGPRMLDAGARAVQVNVSDDAVASSIMRVVELDPQMEATVGVWVDSARDVARRPLDELLTAAPGVDRAAAYLVTESEPVPNTAHPAPPGGRTPGFANVAFLRRPPEMPVSDWLDAWLNHHTDVAITTQATFGYVQNVVVGALTPGAPAIDAVVEELFPEEALTSLHAFFGAADDDDLAARMARMTDSIARFGADRALDVVPTSQYVLRRPFAADG